MSSPDSPIFSRLQRPPAYKIVADALQKAVLEKTLKPGDAFPIEGDLAAQFGVNRSTVREGIRHLEQSGLVVRQGKKLVVSLPSYDQVGDQVSRALIVHDVTFQELWEVKMALEPLAAELAAAAITDDQINRMEANIEATRRALKNGDDLVALDIEFHALIAEASGNRALVMARGAIARLFYPTYKVGMAAKAAGRRLVDAHANIFEAIKAREAQTAAEWMRKHIIDFKRGYEIAGHNVSEPVAYEE
ncbi:MAG: FadR family transcriptional regulator [Rhizobiales bacterium]|nr:FadR family transcriptional regulator [Hyphomicrobiales bacterium]